MIILFAILINISKSPCSDFDGVNLTVIPSTAITSGTFVTLTVTVTAVPAATEIRLSRSDGPFFSSSDSTINRPLGTVTVNDSNHLEYEFTADQGWNGSVVVYVRTLTHNNTSAATLIIVLGKYRLGFSCHTVCMLILLC